MGNPRPDSTIQRGTLVVISGPSGAGKTTIARAVEAAFTDSMFSVSYTTRARSENDRDGVDYHFVTPERFAELSRAGAFLEEATYAGNCYATPREPVERHLATGGLMILEIDVQGGKSVKAAMPEARCMFILPPGEEALLQRLRDRRRDSEEVIQRRFRLAQAEIAEAHRCGVYEAFVVNDALSHAIGEAVGIVRKWREQEAR